MKAISLLPLLRFVLPSLNSLPNCKYLRCINIGIHDSNMMMNIASDGPHSTRQQFRTQGSHDSHGSFSLSNSMITYCKGACYKVLTDLFAISSFLGGASGRFGEVFHLLFGQFSVKLSGKMSMKNLPKLL